MWAKLRYRQVALKILPSLVLTFVLAVPASGQVSQMVDVGGHRLETEVVGEGEPAVVFEAGFIGGMSAWDSVQRAVADVTTTLSYERAGLGGSEVGPEPRTAEQIAVELRELISRADIARPAILVGHSAGGMFVRVFAHMFPEDVAGLVLVDPITEDVYAHMRSSVPERWANYEEEIGHLNPPPGWYGQWRALPQSMEQARQAWPLPKVPTVLLTALTPLPGEWPIDTPENLEVWHRAHLRLIEQFSGVEHLVLPEASHLTILLEDTLVDQTLEMVREIRARR